MDDNYINAPFNDNDACGRFDDPVKIDPSTICQRFPCGGCTLDGKPIWENSIVTDGKRVGVVRFGLYETTNFGFYVEWNVSDRFLREALRKDILYWLPKIKAIGNIFDNPELLEGRNDSKLRRTWI